MPAKYHPPSKIREALEVQRNYDLTFDQAWEEAIRVCFGKRRGEWREVVEWAEPIYRDAYERTGKPLGLSEGMLEEVVV